MSAVSRLAWGICLTAGLFAAPFGLASEAEQWLDRMNESATELSFRGAFIYERTGSFSTHYIWRDQQDGAVTERFLQTDGPVQEWVRRNGELICAGAAPLRGASVLRDKVLPLDPQADIERWYDIEVLGSTRVAARPARVISLRPRDAHRYAYEYYLDEETGLLLKSLLINERQALLERFQFATLELGQPEPAQLDPQGECAPVAHAEPAEELRNSPWQPAWLPPGFAVGEQTARVLEGGDKRLLSHPYSDGLSHFTLFVEPLEEQVAENLRAQLGPTVAVSRRLELEGESYLATVVGEIPAATAERIAASLLIEQGVPAP